MRDSFKKTVNGVRTEEGNLRCNLYEAPEKKHDFVISCAWTSRAAFDAHQLRHNASEEMLTKDTWQAAPNEVRVPEPLRLV